MKLLFGVFCFAAGMSCSTGHDAGPTEPTGSSPTPSPRNALATIYFAGDIANCNDLLGAQQAADLLRQMWHPGDIFIPGGDLAYRKIGANGAWDDAVNEMTECYGKLFGEFLGDTRPVLGNHEYDRPSAGHYFDFFGGRAWPPDGYYAFVIEEQVLVMNFNSSLPADRKSSQYQWAEGVLERHKTPGAIAVWHHPIRSSGKNGKNEVQSKMHEMWRLLVDSGVDLVLTGHDHIYERFERLDRNLEPIGKDLIASAAPTALSFVVGTGGAEFYDIFDVKRGSEKRITRRVGFLRLTLDGRGYRFEFVAARVPDARFPGEVVPETLDTGTDVWR